MAISELHPDHTFSRGWTYASYWERSLETTSFWWVNSAPSVEHQEFTDENDIRHEYRYLNGVPLNDTHFDLEVNFLEYREKRPNGKKQRWVTDLPINEENAMQLMRAGRARWKIENETFNTLKNQGYCFEHNFGHGEKNLSTVFAFLMMLAFLLNSDVASCSGRRKWKPGVPATSGKRCGVCSSTTS